MTLPAFYELAAGRQGHFSMGSGYHSRLWFDLDALFAAAGRVQPFVAALAEQLKPHRPTAVCGPTIGGAFLAQLLAERLGAEFWHTTPDKPTAESGLFPARYRLPVAFRNRLVRPRVTIVDDVMSAGSSLRATYSELRAHGIQVVAVGALLVLGSEGARFFRN